MLHATKDFTFEEFKCKCGTCGGGVMNAAFMQKLQALRDAYGKPMVPSSGFRCSAHNRKEGGSVTSMHLQGRAADIFCEDGPDKFEFIMLAAAAGFNGIGVAKTYVHVDDRETQTFWTY